MEINTFSNISLDKFLYDAIKRYHISKRFKPLIPEARKILFGCNDNIIIGTYDHLRTPFSNRLITGDARFSAIAEKTGVRCISLLLDMTMAPFDRYHKTARGDRIGLYVFSNKLAFLDRIIIEPKQYIPYENAIINIDIDWPAIKNYIHDPIVSFLIEHHKCNKRKTLIVAGEMANRAYQIVEIYKSASNNKHNSISDYLLSVRNQFWKALNIYEYTSDIEKLSVSYMYSKIARTLQLFKGRPWFKRFLNNANIYKFPLMKYISENGYPLGVIYSEYKCEYFKILHPITKKLICKINGWDQLCDMVKKKQSFPTTPILYLLFHLIAGYSHFGNSYDMNIFLCKMLGITPREHIDITYDHTNSIPINEIIIPMGVSSYPQKNITIDIIWHGFTNYRNICDSVFKSGKSVGNYTFGYNLPNL